MYHCASLLYVGTDAAQLFFSFTVTSVFAYSYLQFCIKERAWKSFNKFKIVGENYI